MALLLSKLSCILMPYFLAVYSSWMHVDASARTASFGELHLELAQPLLTILYRNDYAHALCATWTYRYIYNTYGDFLVVLISVGLTQARPNYLFPRCCRAQPPFTHAERREAPYTLWKASSPDIRSLETAFNNLLRRIWNLPRRCHTAILHRVAGVSSTYI